MKNRILLNRSSHAIFGEGIDYLMEYVLVSFEMSIGEISAIETTALRINNPGDVLWVS